MALDREVILSGQARESEFEAPFADGRMRAISATKFPVRNSDGRVIGVGTINTDITERKQAEEALARSWEDLKTARDEAEGANRAKSEFLTTMSHELRTPLNAIIGFSEIIKEETFGPVGSAQYRGYASDIHDSGQHLLGLIDDILDLCASASPKPM